MDRNSDVCSESLSFARSSYSKPTSRGLVSVSSQSAFQRIKKNICQSVLPSFLRVGSRDNLTRSVNLDNSEVPQHVPRKGDEVLLTVNKRMLTRRELLQLKEGGPLTINVVETCLSLIKRCLLYTSPSPRDS